MGLPGSVSRLRPRRRYTGWRFTKPFGVKPARATVRTVRAVPVSERRRVLRRRGTMTSIPAQLTKTFADVDQSAIAAWWSKLTDAHRDEVAKLCDTRADTCFFGVVADESELP